MFFKNLYLFRIVGDWNLSADALSKALSSNEFCACAPSEPFSTGWVAPRPDGDLVHAVNGQFLITLRREEKLLPGTVVKHFAKERALAIEEKEGRKVGRKEMRDIREATAIELLPRAFPKVKDTVAWIDPENGWLVVDASAAAKAEEVLEKLRKTVENFPAVSLVKTFQSPSSCMTGWLASGEGPDGFSIDQELELCSAESAKVKYTKHTLEGKDIGEHIACGKVAKKLGMTWNDRISFVLNENMQIAKLSFLDILKEQAESQAENEDERFDIDFTLMTGELAKMLEAVVQALGGEIKREQ